MSADVTCNRDSLTVPSHLVAGPSDVLALPLLKGDPIGIIVIHRKAVRPFTEKQIELLKTFGTQAVIAIENVRLFQELGRAGPMD